MDFEDELVVNCVRKVSSEGNDDQNQKGSKTFPRTRTTEKYKVLDYIPLTLKHLLTLNQDSWKEQNVISIFNGRFHFKNCLIYCTVLHKSEKAERYTYIVDDGTASMNMSTHRKLKDFNTILQLENEVDAIRRETHAQNKDDIGRNLKKLLLATRKQLHSNSSVNVGSRILIIGKPSYFRETVSLDAFHILKDDSAYRNFEIAFKDELIEWYKNNLLRT